jgi:molybdopterin-guanine dinucleotide biosynthesis protein A
MTTNLPDGFERPGDTVPVYILAGGKSKRFGSDKARWLRDGEPLIVRVARTLKPLASAITVVAASDGEYDDLGLRTIGDVVPDKGPMGGLITAIGDCRESGWLLLSACDWEGLRSEWLQTLLDQRSDKVQAVVFRSDRNEPLLGLYHTSIRGTISKMIDADRLKMQFLPDEVAVASVPVPAGWSEVVNLNRPGDAG